jgi:hypothetical protein
MSSDRPGHLKELLRRIVDPIAASPRRKLIMQEELLAHLNARSHDDLRQFGDPDELQQQLQASIPLLERMFYRTLYATETLMTRILWIIGIIAFAGGANLHFALNTPTEFAGLLLLCALAFKHFCQPNNIASRTLGKRWPWYVALIATCFGTSMVLPAWANLNHGKSAMFFVPLVTGALIVAGGFGVFIYTVRTTRAQIA